MPGLSRQRPPRAEAHGDSGHLASHPRPVRVVPLDLLAAPLRPVIRIRRGPRSARAVMKGPRLRNPSGCVLERPGLDAGGRRTSGPRYARR